MDNEHFKFIDKALVKVSTINELCKALLIKFEEIEKELQYYKNKYEVVCSKKYKDEELSRLKKELEKQKLLIKNGFAITDSEKEAIEKWKNTHACSKSYKTLTYHFTPFEVGVYGKVTCYCGSSFEFSKL